MYSQKVTDANIQKVSKALGFELQRHTLQQIEQQIKRLNEIVGDEGRLTRALRDDEKQFIINERWLCKLDFRYWCSRYVKVLHYEGGSIVSFDPNTAQEIVLDVWAELEEMAVAIMMQALKARQLGISTITEIAMLHRTQFYKHTNGLIASYDPDQSKKMAGMMDRAYENEPWWLKPETTAYRADELREFGQLDSGISIQHGSQFTGLGRGSTPNVAHLSEVSEYIEPEELIDASLLNAMHPSAKMFLVLESTAKGRKNYWHRLWEQSKANYALGKASFYPMFLPWFVGRDIHPEPGWLKKHPIPEEFEPATLTYHHAERAKNYVRSNELLKKFLGEEWEMPIEQMWWWEVTRDEYKAKDILNKFYEEMPADDLEAFQSTNRSAFDADTLSVYRESCKPPIGVFGFRGRPDEIPMRFWPDNREIDTDSPAINIKSRWAPSQTPSECQLVPLRLREWPMRDPMGKLLVWEMPEDEEEYGVGIDTGDGVGLDRTTLEVIRKATVERPWGQAAEFHSPYIGASEFWPVALAVSTLYATYRQGQVRQCRVAIDCLRNGESVQFEMKKHGWWNFHPWMRYDQRRLRHQQHHREGWFSNSWSRAMMMDYIIRALKDEFIDIFSPYFVDEMGDLERDEMRQSLKACFLPGTRVMTWNPSLRPIEQITEGIGVMTHTGRCGQVLAPRIFRFSGTMRRIKVSGLPDKTTCTPTHEFWGKKRTTKYLMRKEEYPSEWIESQELKVGDWIGIPKRTGLPKVGFGQSPAEFGQGDEFLYVAGFWLAEGHLVFDVDGKPCAIALTNTDKGLLENCLRILKEVFPNTIIRNNQFDKEGHQEPCKWFWGERKRHENWKAENSLIYYCRPLAEIFMETFGSGCKNKSIRADLYNSSGLLPLVSGFIDGDGGQREGQQQDVSVYTTSELLAWQLRQILLDNGIWCTLDTTERKPPRTTCWIINIKCSYLGLLYPCKVLSPNRRVKRMVMEDESHFYSPIRSIEKVPYVGPVYDLSVSGDHTYTANGMAVHNTFGGHDDLFVALGQIYFSMIIMDVRSGRPPVMPPPRSGGSSNRSSIVYEDPIWTPGYQATDSGPRDWGTRDELLARVDLEEDE